MNDSTFVNIGDGGPEAVMDLALRVKGAGDDFRETARSLAQSIRDIEGAQPWGRDDKYADAFRQNYMATPEGADQPANQIVTASLGDSGEVLSEIGNRAVNAMGKYLVTDAESAADIGNAGQSA